MLHISQGPSVEGLTLIYQEEQIQNWDAGTHPLNKGGLCGHFHVPQVNVSTLGPHCQRGGMSGVPLQAGDPAVKGTRGAVEMIRRQRADERLLETLEETETGCMTCVELNGELVTAVDVMEQAMSLSPVSSVSADFVPGSFC